jgi:MFS family permease
LTVFLNINFTLLCLAIFFIEYGVLIPMTYIVSYATSHGQDTKASYTLIALLNAGSTAGRIIPGILSDYMGRFNVLILSVGLCAVTVFGLWLPAGDSKPILTAFAVLLGFASGSNVGLVPVCVGQLCDTRDYGRFLSIAMISASFGTLTSIPVGGALLGNGGWVALILFSSFSYLACLFLCASVRVLSTGWQLRAVF